MEKALTLQEIKNKVTDVARKYGIGKAYLFGSCARGKALEKSDIDICIEKGKLRTLFELSGFYQDLEEALGHKVDLVTSAGLSGDFKKQIEKEMIIIYG